MKWLRTSWSDLAVCRNIDVWDCRVLRGSLDVVGGPDASFVLIKCLRRVCVIELWLLWRLWGTSIKVISKWKWITHNGPPVYSKHRKETGRDLTERFFFKKDINLYYSIFPSCFPKGLLLRTKRRISNFLRDKMRRSNKYFQKTMAKYNLSYVSLIN